MDYNLPAVSRGPYCASQRLWGQREKQKGQMERYGKRTSTEQKRQVTPKNFKKISLTSYQPVAFQLLADKVPTLNEIYFTVKCT